MKKPLKYLTNLVTYFDILGFKKLIKQRPAEDISRILHLFRESAESDRREERGFLRTYASFSDLSIRAVVISSIDYLRVESALLDYELESIARIQCKLIEDEGIVVRGGITVGPLLADGKFVFGDGLVSAYEMEKPAFYPRIMISAEIVSIAERNAEENGNSIALSWIARDAHSSYVNYLRVALSERAENDLFAFLSRHADVIAAALNEFSGDSEIRAKYEWMRDYHNTFVHTYFSMFDELVVKL